MSVAPVVEMRNSPSPAVQSRRVLITGATGRVGHYVTEALLARTDLELYLLVRDPRRLRLDPQVRPDVTILRGDLRDIAQFADLLKTMDAAVLAAAAWDERETHEINVTRTAELLTLLNPEVCRQVLYFSTASLIDRQGRLLPEAGNIGTAYIRSKYEGLRRLQELPIASRATVLFLTIVLGGDAVTPPSHFHPDVLSRLGALMSVLRFFRVDGGFHFIHARDVAQVAAHLIAHPAEENGMRSLVLGQQPYTVDRAVEEICAYLGKPIYFRFPLPLALADSLLALFPKAIPPADRAWTRFCLRYRHFTYADPLAPADLGLLDYCPTLTDFLRISRVRHPGAPAVAGHLG